MTPTPETDAYIGEQDEDNMTEGEIAMCELARRLERERDEYRQCWLDEQANRDRWIAVLTEKRDKIRAENAAMREAIREAASQLVLMNHDPECPHLFRVLYGQGKFPCKCGRDATLTKLQLFITNVSQPSEEHNKA